MMELRGVVHDKLTIDSSYELTNQQKIVLDKQTKATHMAVNWDM